MTKIIYNKFKGNYNSLSISNDSIYKLVNGDQFFLKLVDVFYNKVEKDDVLNHMFHNGFEEPKRNLYLFLRKIFGGPDDYIPTRGPPMMRRRHLPFVIGLKERNQWMKLMLESLDELEITNNHPARKQMENYFESVATHMINQRISVEDINEAGKEV